MPVSCRYIGDIGYPKLVRFKWGKILYQVGIPAKVVLAHCGVYNTLLFSNQQLVFAWLQFADACNLFQNTPFLQVQP